jgi:hypothetical protein
MASSANSNQPATDFENLVRNGIDFLEKAISQLKDEPKHSVINFYTAVEIFLKAPLVKEHWSLVIADRDPNRQQYETGDFVSVSFEDACKRLERSLKKGLKPGAIEAFDKVRQHRNRMVHFYHSGTSKKQHDAIMLEQARAWFELNRFVTDDWRKLFEPYLAEFKWMERILVANNHYAQTKFANLRAQIEGKTKGGAVFTTCPRCTTDANEVTSSEPALENLTHRKCLVCFRAETLLQVTCPECSDAEQYLCPDESFTCSECNHEIKGEHRIFRFLDQSRRPLTKDDDIDSDTPANCDECQGYQTVCDYADGYLCTNCFAYFESINHCGYCNAPMTGSDEGTMFDGCEWCEGVAGRIADD